MKKSPSLGSSSPIGPRFLSLKRLAKAKLKANFIKFWEVLKKLQINMPFLDAIFEMPSYAMFLEEMLYNKRNFKKML